MAKKIGFDEKIADLLAYGQALRELPPAPAEGFVVPGLVDRIDWWSRTDSERIRQAESLEVALKRLGFALGSHARVEYGPLGQGFNAKELAKDTDTERLTRSRVLAVMTRPTSFEEIEVGAEAISDFLEKVLTGAEIEIEPFGKHNPVLQRRTVEAGRRLFGVFKPELEDRTLKIQYDTSKVVALVPAEQALAVPLHNVVSGEGISIG